MLYNSNLRWFQNFGVFESEIHFCDFYRKETQVKYKLKGDLTPLKMVSYHPLHSSQDIGAHRRIRRR